MTIKYHVRKALVPTRLILTIFRKELWFWSRRKRLRLYAGEQIDGAKLILIAIEHTRKKYKKRAALTIALILLGNFALF